MEVVIPRRWKGTQRSGTHDLSPEMRERIAWLNGQLCTVEAWLDDWANWFKALAVEKTPQQPEGPWWLDVRISLALDTADPEHDEDSDNHICELFDTLALQPGDDSPCYPTRDWRRDFFPQHPLREMPHCWLSRVLMDDRPLALGWKNILRIGRIWVEANLSFEQTFPRNSAGSTPAISPRAPTRWCAYEGDNWKKTLTAKRLPGYMSCDDLSPANIAFIDALNTRVAGVETCLDAYGRWFDSVYTRDAKTIPPLEDCWDIETRLNFLLAPEDAMFHPGEQNILHSTEHRVGTNQYGNYYAFLPNNEDIANWNEYEHRENHPLRHQHHCWVFHDLYHHSFPRLGWQNILRIGDVQASTRIHLSQSFPPLIRE